MPKRHGGPCRVEQDGPRDFTIRVGAHAGHGRALHRIRVTADTDSAARDAALQAAQRWCEGSAWRLVARVAERGDGPRPGLAWHSRPVETELAARCAPAEGITAARVTPRDLGRYYRLLNAALKTVSLSAADAMAVAYAVQTSSRLEDPDVPLRSLELAPALRAVVEGWSPAQEMAVRDACERFWLRPAEEPPDVSLREVGLVR